MKLPTNIYTKLRHCFCDTAISRSVNGHLHESIYNSMALTIDLYRYDQSIRLKMIYDRPRYTESILTNTLKLLRK